MERVANPNLTEIGLALAILAGAACVAWLLLFLFDRGLGRLVRRTPTSVDNVVLGAVRGPLFAVLMLAALHVALAQLSFLPATWRDTWADIRFVLAVFIVYLLLHRLISRLAGWYVTDVARRTGSGLGEILPFLRRLALIVLGAITLVVLLDRFDVDVSAVVATLGIGSLAIALAAQATLADMISGFVIMADRPFSIGDRIEILELDTWGDVQDIGLRSTRILTRDNRMVVVPNSVIGKSLVVNHSDPSTVYRVQTHLGVAYGTDIETARRILIEAVRAQDWVMREKPVEALFLEFGPSAMIFRVRCWIEHYVDTRRIIDKLNTCLAEALIAASIDSPFPTQTLYHHLEPVTRARLASQLSEHIPPNG